MPKNFLLEVGCEEIPARAMAPVLRELKDKFEQFLSEKKLVHGKIATLGSARRLVVHVHELADEQPTERTTTLGPPEKIAFKDGQASAALRGFSRKTGVPVEDLKAFETERGRYMGFQNMVPGKAAGALLAAGVPDLVRSLFFPKTMYWVAPTERFARPIRWVVALHGSDAIALELYGVRAGTASTGHRVLGSQSISVKGFDDYIRKLHENFVIVSQEDRRKKIEAELEAAVSGIRGRVVPDPDLLEEVVYINEYPTVVMGEFEERFLDLPREVLITVMREHQKYFAIEDSTGTLFPNFLAVTNTNGDAGGQIRKGHERVLRARLSDALFFWDVDRKRTLELRRPSLDAIVFHEKLGTYTDKIERMEGLARVVNDLTGSGVEPGILSVVVGCSKADLTTELVGEFPGLEGIVGGLYARREGASEQVWRAIYDQYRPRGLDDRSPTTPAGNVLALSDRLDTVLGCFSVGLTPTGSEDPLGLRRHTQGIIKILLDHRLPFSMRTIVGSDARLSGEAASSFQSFYQDRLRFILSQRGFAYDEINAALASGADSPSDTLDRVEALHRVRESPDLMAIAGSFKRIKNILKQAGGLTGESRTASGVDLEPEEKALADAVTDLEPQVRAWAQSREYSRALEAMAALRPLVDEFFDKIMVMHRDEAIRSRRLCLLDRLLSTFQEVGDISEMVVSSSR